MGSSVSSRQKWEAVEMAPRIVGLGGSLRASSLSRAALAVALDGAAAAGAKIELLDLRRLELPMFNPEQVVGLISVAGGVQGLQVINTMDFSARSLRAWAVASACARSDRGSRTNA
jgi:predicted phosphoribosyltransferase